MVYSTFAINFFVALFALIDPIGNVALFAAATAGAKAGERAQIAVLISLVVSAFLAFFYFTGVSLLQFFGISLPAFRIAGGMILFLLGLKMVRDDALSFADAAVSGEEGVSYVRRHFERLIVPFAMPLLIGPGAISTVIIYAAEAITCGSPWTVRRSQPDWASTAAARCTVVPMSCSFQSRNTCLPAAFSSRASAMPSVANSSSPTL